MVAAYLFLPALLALPLRYAQGLEKSISRRRRSGSLGPQGSACRRRSNAAKHRQKKIRSARSKRLPGDSSRSGREPFAIICALAGQADDLSYLLACFPTFL